MSLIELKNLTKIYKMGDLEVPALKEVDLDINLGDFLAIMGPSGSGKTTLMNLIGLLDCLTEGSYKLKDEEVAEFSQKKRAKLRNQEIGFVFQVFNLLPRLTALGNVTLPLTYNKEVPVRESVDRAKRILDKVDLNERIKHKPNQLSGGERQRVAIARALVCEPSIILADEPTGNLDTKSGLEVMEILKKLNEEGKTIIVVTHEEEIAEYARRHIKLKDGCIVKKS